MRTKKVSTKNADHRQKIVEATEQQAIEKGFHKASMSDIAKAAGLSVGQIYRYFAHKDEIICEVVEQTTNKHLQMMVYFLDKKDWLLRHFSKESKESHSIRAIHSEIQAEAARNERIAKICYESHERLQTHAVGILQTRYPFMGKAEALARLELLVTFTEGLFARWDYQSHPLSAEFQLFCNQMLDSILPDITSSMI